MDVQTLKVLLPLAWSGNTAYGDWNSRVPSLNQCAVTALVVQEYLGGDLLRCKMTNGDSHYWNRLPDGTEVDLTEDQFNYIEAKPIKSEYIVRSREYTLSFVSTSRRYDLLSRRIQAIIDHQPLPAI